MTPLEKDLAEVVLLIGAEESCNALSILQDRENVNNACFHFIRTHHAEIVQNAIDAAKYRNDGTTHAEGCHTWGPKHYECLVEQYKQAFHEARRLRALEQALNEALRRSYDDFAPVPWIKQRADEIMRERSTPECE